ncbi:MAG: hypothetical protein IKX88_08280 [Thermoguttaceae bacterium]|nr:hypothetical protein [Thermoguttaceae bacterium]
MILATLLIVSLIAALLGCFFPSRRVRLLVFIAVAGLAFARVSSKGTSFGSWLYAVFDTPAVTTVSLAFYYWIWRKRSKEEEESEFSEKDASRKISSASQRRVCGAIILLTSVVLWLSETNVIAFDFYRLGFLQPIRLGVVCLAIVLLNVRLSLLAVVAYLATEFGLYANFFDAILDPFLTAYLLVYFFVIAVKKRLRKA